MGTYHPRQLGVAAAGVATLQDTSNSLAGRLSVGVIPTALPMAELITSAMRDPQDYTILTVANQTTFIVFSRS